MRQIQITFPTQNASAICATQTITATAGGFLVLNGSLASPNNFNAPASSTTAAISPFSTTAADNQPYQFVTLPNIARPLTSFATSTATGVVFKAFGLDLLGNFITASWIGASGGSSTASDAVATGSGTDFHVVQAISLSASMANVTIGTGVTGTCLWLRTDTFVNPFNMTISVVTPTSQPVTVQNTPDNPGTVTAPATFNHPTLVGVTANTQGNYLLPVRFVRAIFTATTQATGQSVVYFEQAGV